MAEKIAEVVFNIPLERSFHYLIPEELHGSLQQGMRVMAPFGPRDRMGFVVDRVGESPVRELKPIRHLIDPRPVITDERWPLAEWLSRYYYCSLGETLCAMVPNELRWPGDPVLRSSNASATPHGPEMTNGHRLPAVKALQLSLHQRRAFAVIPKALEAPTSRTILLHGVTGSGKTEVYLRAIEHVLRQGRSALYLVPEIALTPQAIDRFRERFADTVLVWHSRVTKKTRRESWARIADGTCRVVIGARSAIFSPVRRLGLVILDEEHEATYKQGEVPRFHAREVACARARFAGATVLLGSATPSIESYYTATRRTGTLITLPERVEGRALPQVEIIDMREEQRHGRRASPLSARLQRALEQAVERGGQAMLLLNRRGFARIVQCPACATVARCERCAVPLIYHAARQILRCHYCRFQTPFVELCGQCRKGYLRLRGSGTERIESELHRLFPAASIARMDRDTTTVRESHRAIYDAVKQQQIGLLVGTQMIAKGLDFPQVTLVGVVSADTALNLPDFRAGERTFDLLTQMAGRAGRGRLPGQVLIQTYCPTHYAIVAAKAHDYRRFYDEELAMRRRLALPPFAHLVELMLRGSSMARVEAAAQRLAARLHRAATGHRVTLLGPAPHRIPRLRRAYRVSLLLKGRAVEPIVALLRRTLQPGRRFEGLPVTVDVDPL